MSREECRREGRCREERRERERGMQRGHERRGRDWSHKLIEIY